MGRSRCQRSVGKSWSRKHTAQDHDAEQGESKPVGGAANVCLHPRRAVLPMEHRAGIVEGHWTRFAICEASSRAARDGRYGDNDSRRRVQFHDLLQRLRHRLHESPREVQKVTRAFDFQSQIFDPIDSNADTSPLAWPPTLTHASWPLTVSGADVPSNWRASGSRRSPTGRSETSSIGKETVWTCRGAVWRAGGIWMRVFGAGGCSPARSFLQGGHYRRNADLRRG